MNIRQQLFQYRSYSPMPFLVVMVLFSRPTVNSLVAGFVVVLCGEFLRLWGVAIAGSETRTTGPVGGTFLITRGPFAHMRNPLYVGNIMIYCGVGIMSMAVFPWLVIVALLFFLLQYAMIVSLEEEYLARTFGEEYRNYCNAVPRFLPRINRYRGGINIQPDLDWWRGVKSEKSTLLAITLVSAILFEIYHFRG